MPTSAIFKFFGIATTSLLLANVANASPKIYGGFYLDTRATEEKVTKTYSDGTVEVEKTKARPQLFDNGSRMGIQGESALNDNLNLLYRVEWRSPFDTEKRAFEPRDSWLAVKHKEYGTLKAGRLLSPEPYVRYTWSYPTAGADGNRSNNAIRYESPTIKDTNFMVHYVMDENNDTDLHGTDGFGLFANHKKENYGLGGAYFYANGNKVLHGVTFKDQFRLTGFYDINKENQINFIYQKNRFNDVHYGQKSKDNWGIGVGGSHKLNDRDAVYAHYDYAKNPWGKDGDYNSFVVAADRTLKSGFILGAELSHSKEKINVPSHTDKDGKSVLAHKQNTDSTTLIFYSAYRF